MEESNSSGHGPSAIVPAEVDRWNWGAFLLNWIWGIGNNTFISLLMFVPFAGFIMMFVLGIKGSAWAWRNKRWESVEQFKAVQRQWSKWGLIVCVANAVLFGGLIFSIFSMLKGSEPFKIAVARLESNQEVSQLLGRPLSTGIPMGSIQVVNEGGRADLYFSVEGPKGKGTVYVDAVREDGNWKINKLYLDEKVTGRQIDLNLTVM